MPRGLNVLTGSCPWPRPWFRTHGAHLHLQAREDPNPTALAVPSTDLMTIANEKKILRQSARATRARLAVEQPYFAPKLVSHAAALPLAPKSIVAIYLALPGEADPAPLAQRLAGQGHTIAYPRVSSKTEALTFHTQPHGKTFVRGDFDVMEPAANWPRVTPDVLLVPLLAFDAQGYRLGYGGGYYDRTLEALRAAGKILAIGIAYAGQQVDTLPREAHDHPLDAIVTELGFRGFTGNQA